MWSDSPKYTQMTHYSEPEGGTLTLVMVMIRSDIVVCDVGSGCDVDLNVFRWLIGIPAAGMVILFPEQSAAAAKREQKPQKPK